MKNSSTAAKSVKSANSTQVSSSTHIETTSDTSFEHVSSGSHSSSLRVQSDAKQKLNELNDRLAMYIEKVKNLETQNAELVLKYRELEIEQHKIETHEVDYKQQNDNLRRQIELANTTRVRAELEQKKIESDISDLRLQAEKNSRELASVVEERKQFEDECARIKKAQGAVDDRRMAVENELNELKIELSSTLLQNDSLKIELEKATLVRTELQDRINSELGTYDRLLESEEQRLHY